MPELQRTPGRKVTRRLTDPSMELRLSPKNPPTNNAHFLAEGHNRAVREYGSNSDGWHAFDPNLPGSAGVFESGSMFPRGSVVSSLAWGQITAEFAQRLLEYDGVA